MSDAGKRPGGREHRENDPGRRTWWRCLPEEEVGLRVAEAVAAEREHLAQAVERGEWDDIFRPAIERVIAAERARILRGVHGIDARGIVKTFGAERLLDVVLAIIEGADDAD